MYQKSIILLCTVSLGAILGQNTTFEETVLEFLVPNSIHLLIDWSPYAQEAQELFKAGSS